MLEGVSRSDDLDARAKAMTEAVHRELVAPGLLAPVADEDAEHRRYAAIGLVSLVELCAGERLEPEKFNRESWSRWQKRFSDKYVIEDFEERGERHAEGRYWILRDGEPVGTITLPPAIGWPPFQSVEGLYMQPEHRRSGLTGAVLDRVSAAAFHVGYLGTKLSTEWTWPNALRFYLARGFWVWNWKHAITLATFPSWPKWRTSFDGASMSFSLLGDAEPDTIYRAKRRSDILELEIRDEHLDIEQRSHGLMTFSLLLALAGWPLVRDESSWSERHRSMDAGYPEGLAEKIRRFEGVAREAGLLVDTTEIPGLRRWQAWGEGEDFGRRAATRKAIETVARTRGLSKDGGEARLAALGPYELDHLLRITAEADSPEAWTEALDRWTKSRL